MKIVVRFVFLALMITAVLMAQKGSPNVVVIFGDDIGYGDVGVFGHPTIKTPKLDRMAREGQKWTNFYAAASVCTPSRAGLLTGRLPIRSGMMHPRIRVLFPESLSGLQQSEVTIAEVLKQKNYTTMHVGKWHLGHLPDYLPTKQGFDSYYGIPYSNDMDQTQPQDKHRWALFNPDRIDYWDVPLMRNEKIIERPANQYTITKRYTEEAVKFIKKNKDRPFFLYLAHTMMHVPLFRSEKFVDKSIAGIYGDAMEEVDWSVGQVLETVRKNNLSEKTLVIFTSDNGPWLIFDTHGGSAGPLKEGKGSTWEGGMREPTIMWWPGTIPAGTTQAGMGSTLDLMATVASITNTKMPKDRKMDSYDLSLAMSMKADSPRNEMFFWRGTKLFAARSGNYKAHFYTQTGYRDRGETRLNTPLLYHLGHDPGEKVDISRKKPEIVTKIQEMANQHILDIEEVENQLEKIGERN
ncbi:MAG: sulfatase [Dehalococcoidia bacterium]|jgi:arylsulfatase A-like enzyme|nr:sulfatase [Dehalococcoidia bacterium]